MNVFELTKKYKYVLVELLEFGGTMVTKGFYESLHELSKDFTRIQKEDCAKGRQFLVMEIRDAYDGKTSNEDQWLMKQIEIMEKKSEYINKTVEGFKERLAEIRGTK